MTFEPQDEKSLYRLLKQELICFNEILNETNSFLDQFDSFSLDSLSQLLQARQNWIEEIKTLESKRIRMIKIQDGRNTNMYLQQSIAEIAKTLIVIDAKILDVLEPIKSKFINDMAKVADNKSRMGLSHRLRRKQTRLVDILQE